MRTPSQAALLAAMLLTAAACGDGQGPVATVGPVVARIEIVGSDSLGLQLSVGETRQLTATAFDDEANPIAATTLSWRSGDETVARVDQDGLVTAIDAGGTRIFAEAGLVADSVPISVFEDSGGTGADGG